MTHRRWPCPSSVTYRARSSSDGTGWPGSVLRRGVPVCLDHKRPPDLKRLHPLPDTQVGVRVQRGASGRPRAAGPTAASPRSGAPPPSGWQSASLRAPWRYLSHFSTSARREATNSAVAASRSRSASVRGGGGFGAPSASSLARRPVLLSRGLGHAPKRRSPSDSAASSASGLPVLPAARFGLLKGTICGAGGSAADARRSRGPSLHPPVT